jgi:hypothetical protein
MKMRRYDGQRVQIHARRRAADEPIPKEDRLAGAKSAGGRWIGQDRRVYIRLFSRHLEDSTCSPTSGGLADMGCSDGQGAPVTSASNLLP